MSFLLSLISFICLIYIIYKGNETKNELKRYKEENERLKTEIESLKNRQ